MSLNEYDCNEFIALLVHYFYKLFSNKLMNNFYGSCKRMKKKKIKLKLTAGNGSGVSLICMPPISTTAGTCALIVPSLK